MVTNWTSFLVFMVAIEKGIIENEKSLVVVVYTVWYWYFPCVWKVFKYVFLDYCTTRYTRKDYILIRGDVHTQPTTRNGHRAVSLKTHPPTSRNSQHCNQLSQLRIQNNLSMDGLEDMRPSLGNTRVLFINIL